jgi:hypothetical protein
MKELKEFEQSLQSLENIIQKDPDNLEILLRLRNRLKKIVAQMRKEKPNRKIIIVMDQKLGNRLYSM